MADKQSDAVVTVSLDDRGVLRSPTSLSSTGTFPTSIAVHPSGSYVYVAEAQGSAVSVFGAELDGKLALVSRYAMPRRSYPQAVYLHPSGRAAYVLEGLSHQIGCFSIGADGAMEFAERTPAGLRHPSLAALAPGGRSLYVVGTHLSRLDLDSNDMPVPHAGLGIPVCPWPMSLSVGPQVSLYTALWGRKGIARFVTPPDGDPSRAWQRDGILPGRPRGGVYEAAAQLLLTTVPEAGAVVMHRIVDELAGVLLEAARVDIVGGPHGIVFGEETDVC